MYSFFGFDIFWVSGDGVSMSFDCWLELILVLYLFIVSKGFFFFLAHEHFGLIVDSKLNFIFAEGSASVAHGFEHGFVFYFAFPDLVLLFLDLFLPAVGIGDVCEVFEEFGLYSGGGVGDDVGGLGFYFAAFIFFCFFLLELLLLLMRVGCVGAE